MPMDWRTAVGWRTTSWPASSARPRGRLEQGGQHVDGGGLAGAVGAEEAEDFAAGAPVKSTASTAVKLPKSLPRPDTSTMVCLLLKAIRVDALHTLLNCSPQPTRRRDGLTGR